MLVLEELCFPFGEIITATVEMMSLCQGQHLRQINLHAQPFVAE